MNTDTTSSPGRAEEQSISARLYGSACDTCRRRRVKCDGQQPCARCVRSSVTCTYGSLISRKSSVSYARHLEEQIERLQTVLKEQSQTASVTVIHNEPPGSSNHIIRRYACRSGG
ncbi:hypothetical protein V1508DRAFT_421948 [Lipomyces doorenjongii]|uniref:uncharacterized protein n=1 Tax=Lipomyces doorenjongii TaxID=383834 RepID=UPI0034CFC91A